jgi:type IV secretory pathway TraG/TraD family ATPase VirD4
MEGTEIKEKKTGLFLNLYLKSGDKSKPPFNLSKFFRQIFDNSEQSINRAGLVLGMGRPYGGGAERAISINDKERSQHIYVIGATRSGKTKAIESWIRQDINNGSGVGIIDPHGDLTDDILSYIASKPNFDPRRLIYIDPTNPNYCVGFNPLEIQKSANPYSQVLELVGAFKKIWADSWGARMEEILRNTLLTLAVSGLTLLEASRLLTDESFRAFVLSQNLPEDVTEYWKYRFNPLPERERATWIESSLNKINTFCADPYIRLIIGQTKSTFSLRDIMDNGKILLVNLAKGKLKENAFLLGALLLAKIQVTTLSRVDVSKDKRTPWHLYVDEFQNFATDSFAEILSESAKFGLSLTLAHQNLDQLKKETPLLKGAILGNAGTHVYFRVSREDAEILAKEMFNITGKVVKEDKTDLFGFGGKKVSYYPAQEEFEYYCQELTSQGQREGYIKLRRHREPYLLSSLEVLPAETDKNKLQNLMSRSMNYYATPKNLAESIIAKRKEGVDYMLKANNSEQQQNYKQEDDKQTSQNQAKKQENKGKKERKKDGRRKPITEEEFFGE